LCRLYYNSSCPDEYEPTGFRAAGHNDLRGFENEPQSLQVGKILTGHHEMLVKVKTSTKFSLEDKKPE